MAIDLKKFYELPEEPVKNDKQLLEYMDPDKAYTTTDLQHFLKIKHPATLQRLKKLQIKGFVERRMDNNKHYWRKIKEWPEEEEEMAIAGGDMIVG